MSTIIVVITLLRMLLVLKLIMEKMNSSAQVY